MKLSVIIPVYNCELQITRCIESIINQTYKNVEIIIVDDGSKDQSGKLCDQLKEKDNRIIVIHQKNSGVSEARNTGLKVCSGELITFVDADDYLMDCSIYENAIHKLNEEKVDLVGWLWQYEMNDTYVVSKENIHGVKYGINNRDDFLSLLYKGNYQNGLVVSVYNKIYRRDIISGEMFKYKIYEDDDWSIRVLLKNKNIYLINDFGYVYTENTDSLTHQKFASKNLKFLDVLKNRQSLLSYNKKLLDQAIKLYCEIYIEYYYKSKKNKLNFPSDINTFNRYKQMSNLSLKTRLRFFLFSTSPLLYEKLIWRN